MEISQTIKSTNDGMKAFSTFLSMYARVVVTYLCGAYFLVFGMLVLVQRVVHISLQNKITFMGVIFAIFAIAILIHRNDIKLFAPLSAIILGNSFGFVFSFIYSLGNIAKTYNYPFSFFEIEKYVFVVPGGKADMNMMETMYGFVGGLLFVVTMIIIVGYGLSVRDKYKNEEATLLSFFPVIAAVAAVIGIFLVAIFYPSVIWYSIYALTGSMLYIYGVNLFTRKTLFLKSK